MKIACWLSNLVLICLLGLLSWRFLSDHSDPPISPAAEKGIASAPAVIDRTSRVEKTIVAPTLVKPGNPLTFGAKCDGVTDDSAAFQAALNAGDVLVPARTCVIDHTVQITVSNRHLACEPGATLRQTNPYEQRMFEIVSLDEGTLSGDSIANCVFVGANTAAPRYFDGDARHYNIPVQTQDRVSNFMLIGNTFSRFFGQAMFQTYGRVDGGSGDVIAYNRFESCGYYGAALVAHRNGYIGHNVLVDCALGVENDAPSQMSGGNVIEYNHLSVVHGYGAPDMKASAMLTGGTAGGADYSGNVVRYNTVSGRSQRKQDSGSGLPSFIWQKASGGAAQYLQNTCVDGCEVIQ
ncbi:hypothetical protein P3T18_001528 [Paraburkholderia sp. GAS199]|uniref:glycosyl hydrolase family 28-related protein n=1 Tax=Paraburkholderia sp. GAS199 TaxID=3035126 RepID=UPI003D19DD11